MKKLMTLCLMLVTLTVSAQEFSAPVKAKTEFKDSTTTFTYRDNKNVVHKVFVSARGSYYYWKKNKKGELRKYSIPKEVQIKMGRKYDK